MVPARLAAVFAALLVALCMVAYGLSGLPAAVGVVIGTAFTCFSILTIWLMIKAVTPAAGRRGTATTLVILLFLFKMPVLAICVLAAVRLGTSALAGFLAGIVLVYSALIWRAQSAHSR